MSGISKRLLEFRNQHKKSQREMAELMQIPFRTLQDCERGKTLPSANTLIAYARLGADINWILSDHDLQVIPAVQNTWADRFVPIPWFAPNDVRETYEISFAERLASAKTALSNEQLKQLLPRGKYDAGRALKLASTSVNNLKSLVIFDCAQTTPERNLIEFVVVVSELKVLSLQRLNENVVIEINGKEVSEFDPSTRILGRVISI